MCPVSLPPSEIRIPSIESSIEIVKEALVMIDTAQIETRSSDELQIKPVTLLPLQTHVEDRPKLTRRETVKRRNREQAEKKKGFKALQLAEMMKEYATRTKVSVPIATADARRQWKWCT